VTQTNQAALLRVDVTYEGHTLRLWLTPNNMYLRGFTNAAGVTFSFNDFNLQRAMLDLYEARSPDTNLLPNLNAFHQLAYGSGYVDVVREAGRDRTQTPMSYSNLLASLYPLLRVTVPEQLTARALLFFIQYVSEAARFRPVANMLYGVMNGTTATAGVPGGLQELENDWSAVSTWAHELRAGLNPRPLYVGPHYGTINSLRQLTAAIMLLLGRINQVPPPGDFKHTEL
jgi:hypothetical protein